MQLGGGGLRYLAVVGLLFLALFSLTDTWAIQTGSVSNSPVVTVTTTGPTLIQLEAGSGGGNAAGTAYMVGNELRLDFTKGDLTSGYGFKGSQVAGHPNVIKYKGLFNAKNNSDESLCVSVYVPDADAGDLGGIYIRSLNDTTTDGTRVASSGGAYQNCVSVAAGAKVQVDFWWSMRGSATPTGSYNFNVRVEGKR